MLLLLILLTAIFLAGVWVGAKNPSVLTKAQADLHAAQAEATRFQTALLKRSEGN